MSILDLLPGILRTAGKILGIDILGSAGKTLEDAQIPAEKRAELQAALLAHEAQMKQLGIDELKVLLSEPLAMIASEDKFVKRARPSGLYLFYGATVLVVLTQIFLTVYAALNGEEPIRLDATAILVTIGPLAGVGGTYVYRRTQEKMNGSNGK